MKSSGEMLRASWRRYWRHFEPSFVITTVAIVLSALVGHESDLAKVVFKFLDTLEDLGSLENLFHLVLLLINTNLVLAAVMLPHWEDSMSFMYRKLSAYAMWSYDLMAQGMAIAAGSLIASYPLLPLFHDQSSPISGQLTIALLLFSLLYQFAREMPEWDVLQRKLTGAGRRLAVIWVALLLFSSIDIYLWLT